MRMEINYTYCKRCGVMIAAANKSVYGLDELKARLGNICERCITPEEKQEIQNAIAEQLLRV